MEKKPVKRPRDIKDSLSDCFTSPNEMDSNGENANVVDALCRIASALYRIADAINKQKEPPF